MAYHAFQKAVGARSEHSVRKMCTNTPQFLQGITRHVLVQVDKYLKDYNYSSDLPLALSVDDMKLLAAFQPYFYNQLQKWFIAGGIGSPIEVVDIKMLNQQLHSMEKSKATKLCLWTLQIVLLHIPPGIIAYEPLVASNMAQELAEMEKKLLNLLVGELGLKIISLGSDGAIVECKARNELWRSGYCERFFYDIPHPNPQFPLISFPLLKVHGQAMAVAQDPKHAQKTMCNNLFSAFDTQHTPLYYQDVEKLNHQDDHAAARLFSADMLAYIACYDPGNMGLFVYLYVFGEMIDGHINTEISHIALVAYEEALSLWELFGYFPSNDSTHIIQSSIIPTPVGDLARATGDGSDGDGGTLVGDSIPTGWQELQSALEAANHTSSLTESVEQVIEECSFAAAALAANNANLIEMSEVTRNKEGD
ncbi:hypothetical protein BDQ17DRAFT_1431918 [Cyathus striatus]|nr:hypothetical protein BDQ17DRAFT_1431918 [Cyathus striatus]